MVYEVSVSAEYAVNVLVRAESPEEAQDKIWAMLSNGKINPLEERPDYNVLAQVEFEDDDEDIAGEEIIQVTFPGHLRLWYTLIREEDHGTQKTP